MRVTRPLQLREDGVEASCPDGIVKLPDELVDLHVQVAPLSGVEGLVAGDGFAYGLDLLPVLPDEGFQGLSGEITYAGTNGIPPKDVPINQIADGDDVLVATIEN